MDTALNALHSSAITAYDSQQRALGSTRNQATNSGPSAPPTPTTTNQQRARGDVVSFSNQALQLSSQNQNQAQSTQTVNQANSAQGINSYPPESLNQQQAQKVASAQTPTQAINAYYDTSKL